MSPADPNLTLNSDAIQSLADRLFSRGTSKLFDDSPSVQTDLRTASRVIRSLLSEVDRVATVAGDIERSLRNLKIAVEP
jgi:hypothetical protein